MLHRRLWRCGRCSPSRAILLRGTVFCYAGRLFCYAARRICYAAVEFVTRLRNKFGHDPTRPLATAQGMQRLHRVDEHEETATRVCTSTRRLRNLLFRYVEFVTRQERHIMLNLQLWIAFYNTKTGDENSPTHLSLRGSSQDEKVCYGQLQRVDTNRKNIKRSIFRTTCPKLS